MPAPEFDSSGPVTQRSLTEDIASLGITPGDVLLTHCAFSKLGNVYGGPQALVQALQASVGPEGTLVMPTHSTQLTEPSRWQRPPAPEEWWPTIRAELPVYDRARTPTRAMGAVPELFRRFPDVVRSNHPHGSFAAWGANAARITQVHDVDCIFGERSPLAALYDCNAKVLLLGVGHGNNTSLHLAEYRSRVPNKPYHTEGAPMLVDGERQWLEFSELVINSDDFETLGAAFAEQTDAQHAGHVAAATAITFRMRAVVDFAVDWFNANRGGA